MQRGDWVRQERGKGDNRKLWSGCAAMRQRFTNETTGLGLPLSSNSSLLLTWLVNDTCKELLAKSPLVNTRSRLVRDQVKSTDISQIKVLNSFSKSAQFLANFLDFFHLFKPFLHISCIFWKQTLDNLFVDYCGLELVNCIAKSLSYSDNCLQSKPALGAHDWAFNQIASLRNYLSHMSKKKVLNIFCCGWSCRLSIHSSLPSLSHFSWSTLLPYSFELIIGKVLPTSLSFCYDNDDDDDVCQ